VITLNSTRKVIEDGALVVVGDKISEIGEKEQILAKYLYIERKRRKRERRTNK
jgi:hypothetical protein